MEKKQDFTVTTSIPDDTDYPIATTMARTLTTQTEVSLIREEIYQALPAGIVTTRVPTLTKLTTRHSTLEERITGQDEKDKTVHYVNWEENDPENPHNWSPLFRWSYTLLVAFLVISAAFGSSCITGNMNGAVKAFGVSMEVSTLQVSLMVIGFMCGPLLWSPLSEMIGRRPVYAVALGIYTLFNIPCALAQNIATVLVCRFFSGFFGSASLTLAGGSIADLFPPATRGTAIAFFASAPYSGSTLGPLICGWITDWRWIYWVNMIVSAVLWVAICLMPETYAPVLLSRRAKRMRQTLNDDSYVTVEEEFPIPLSEVVYSNLIRPFQMLLTEPILLLMSCYIAIIYALLYGFFFAYPVVFSELHHMNDGQIGLMFIGVLIGTAFALITTPQLEKRYRKTAASRPNKQALPEDRLPGMMLAAPFIPISLFIFGWTSFPWVHWTGPASAGIPFGFGMVLVYYAANNYIIECYPRYVTSALAAKTVVRSGGGAAFPLFIVQMYHGLGYNWASTLLALVSLAIVPIPFAFYRWGARVRQKSQLCVH
ncbi:MFS general substrate transporter [Hesseltinella vesiculosa]|uniref:MFS general substrate transporter n=1 Tax=Hesseltinella vesiculosa TaxID=101127 RepID=A0A1X2GM07_9FUNG|nr:MFS general substrate transporter [Hesseltinella vesiculosa]